MARSHQRHRVARRRRQRPLEGGLRLVAQPPAHVDPALADLAQRQVGRVEREILEDRPGRLVVGHRQAAVLGYIGVADSSDFFQLGTLSAGATIQLRLSQPASSGLVGGLSIYNAGGGFLAYSPIRATNLTVTS